MRQLGLVIALFGALGIFVVSELEVTTDVTHFISTGTETAMSSVSVQLAESALTRTMILSIGGPDLHTAVAAAREWVEVLAQHPEVAQLRSGPADGFGESVFELYFPRRFFFLSSRPEIELPERFSDTGLRETARRLRVELALPDAQLVKNVAPSDPLLAFASLLRRFERARLGGLRISDGHFVDGDASFLDRSFQELAFRRGQPLSLERSGVHRFAASSERRARADIARISGVSITALVILFLGVFRSVRLLFIAFVPLTGGILVATALGILVFGRLHALTLVFGSTLIGVCIDYPIHYMNHHTMLPGAGGPKDSLKRVWPALAMGALTTVAGFAALAVSDFPGIREIGIFAGVGVLAALLVTCWLVPPLLPAAPHPAPIQSRVAGRLGRLSSWLEAHRSGLVAIPLAAAALCMFGLPRVSWQDDVYALNLPLDEVALREDARVRTRVSRADAGRFVLALGGDDESLLRANDAVYERLSAASEAGTLDAFHSLHSFLWSEELQERNLAELARTRELGPRTIAVLEEEGFRAAAFTPFLEALEATPDEPLRMHDLLNSPLADLVSTFRIELDGEAALVTFLRGVRDPAALEAALAGLDDVHYFDQQRFLQEVYGRYRDATVPLIAIGLLAVVGLVQLRYRSARRSLAVAAPAFLAAGATLSVFAIGGVPINLLHLLGLLLVLGFGVDYSIFLIETPPRTDHTAATLVSLVIACISTCLAFGLLAMSSFPALRALGATTGLGVLLSLVLAPTTLVLLGARNGGAEDSSGMGERPGCAP
jgi:predicted exporter